MNNTQPLPHSIEAEQQILGMVLQKNDIMVQLIGTLTPDDFYNTANKEIYENFIKMYQKNIAIDITTFVNSIDRDKLQAIGGVSYLSEMLGSVMSTANSKQYIRIIKENSIKRQIIKGCNEAISKAYQTENDSKDIINNLNSKFIENDYMQSESTMNAFQLMDGTLTLIQKNYQNGGQITGISTGYKQLDNAIGGLNKQDYIIIAARPSMGKTALTLNIINNIPKDKNVAMFELDMSKEKIGLRMLASKSLTNSTALSRGKVSDDDFSLLAIKAGQISEKNNFYLNCRSNLTMGEIKAEAQKIKIRYGLDIVVIDHIGKVKANNPRASRNDQLGQISGDCKNLAKELDICVIALSQLSRRVEDGADKHPHLADLRDSGNLEQDADTILLLYRDDYYAERESRDSRNPGIMEIMVGKNRDGEAGLIELSYKPEYQLITDITDYKCVGTNDSKIFTKGN